MLVVVKLRKELVVYRQLVDSKKDIIPKLKKRK